MPSSHLILCRPLLLLPPIPPSIRVFSNESALCMRWPKYWSFTFSISPSNEHPGLISFRMDWLDLLAVWGTVVDLWYSWVLYPLPLWNSKVSNASLAYIVTRKMKPTTTHKSEQDSFRSYSINKELTLYKAVKYCQSNWVNCFSCLHWTLSHQVAEPPLHNAFLINPVIWNLTYPNLFFPQSASLL